MKNKVAIITGASAGIGRELTLQAGALEMKVAVIARRKERLLELAAELNRAGACDTLIIPADVGSRPACESIIRQVLDTWGQIDLLINNAGFAVSSEVADLEDIGKFERVMDVNFRSAMWLTHAALPHLIRTKGRICSISSVAGLFSMGGSASYNASKFAMRGFFDALRQEVKEHDVSVTVIYPGYVVTEFASRVQDEHGRERGSAALGFYKNHMMTAKRCASKALKATIKRKREKVFTFGANAARWIQLIAPGFLDSFVNHYRKKKKLKREGSNEQQ